MKSYLVYQFYESDSVHICQVDFDCVQFEDSPRELLDYQDKQQQRPRQILPTPGTKRTVFFSEIFVKKNNHLAAV